MFIVSETSQYRLASGLFWPLWRRRERNFEKMFVFRHETTPKTTTTSYLYSKKPSLSSVSALPSFHFCLPADRRSKPSSPPSGRPASIEHGGSYRAPPVHRGVAAAFSSRNRRDGNSVSGGSAEQMRPGLEKAALPATCCVECGVMIRTDAASVRVV